MDYNILKNIMSKHLLSLDINTFDNGVNGTLKLAENHIKTISDCTSKRLSNSEINLYYKNEIFGNLNGQIPSTTKKSAVKLCKNKLLTENLLKKNGIKTTNSFLLGINDFDVGQKLVSESEYPLVIKPLNMYAGKGIMLNVNNSNYQFAWTNVKEEYEKTSKKFQVLLQPQLPGIETRVLVVENKFNSAILRVPANVVGDGIHTIYELIETKNTVRMLNPHLQKLPIKISDIVNFNLKQLNKNVNTIPNENEIVFLHNSSNISLGGDSYEISHLIGASIKDLAEKTVKAIPGIRTAGVDVMFEYFEDQHARVLEVNPGANLRMHHYPFKGQPKAPVNDLIDSILKDYKKIILNS